MVVEISDVYDLQDIELNLAEDYVLVNDIDCSPADPSSPNFDGVEWTSAGFRPVGTLTGSLDGAGFTIKNLYISTSNAALFSAVDGGIVKNLLFDNCTIIGVSGAAVVSRNNSSAADFDNITIINSSVEAEDFVGGLLAHCSSAAVDNVFCDVSINKTAATTGVDGSAGCFVGRISGGTITNVLTVGTVTGSGDLGALVGSADKSGWGFFNCFFDETVAGISDGVAATTGLTTAESKTRSTFTDTATTGLDTAWSMAPENNYNSNFVWGIGLVDGVLVNDGYPFLMSFFGLSSVFVGSRGFSGLSSLRLG